MFKRYWKLDKHVLTLLCCKNYYVCLIETENKQKGLRMAHLIRFLTIENTIRAKIKKKRPFRVHLKILGNLTNQPDGWG